MTKKEFKKFVVIINPIWHKIHHPGNLAVLTLSSEPLLRSYLSPVVQADPDICGYSWHAAVHQIVHEDVLLPAEHKHTVVMLVH